MVSLISRRKENSLPSRTLDVDNLKKTMAKTKGSIKTYRTNSGNNMNSNKRRSILAAMQEQQCKNLSSSSSSPQKPPAKRGSLESQFSNHTAKTAPMLSVSFYPKVECKKSTHLNDYTPEELKACWYEAAEYRAMKRNVNFIVKQMERKEECTLHCTRGLEHRTRDNRNAKRDSIDCAILAVLEEQEFRYVTNASMEEMESAIASAYATKSKASADQARHRAFFDAQEAM